jgi:2,5-dihydroxypyridine 5,6-dioxygenase
MKDILMSRGARTAVEVCAGVAKGERALVITDTTMLPIAEAVARAVVAVGAEPVVAIMPPRDADGQEPPDPVAAAMVKSDVFFAVVSKSITHTKSVRDAAQAGSRGVMLTQFSEEMMVHGGLEADFRDLAPLCQKMAAAMAGAKLIRLTTRMGTDLTLSAEGRPGNALTCMVGKGQFSPIPNVEANVSPIEGSAQGVIVADASIPYTGIGVLREPVTVRVKDGNIVDVSGGDQAKMLRDAWADKKDPLVYNVAELGVGLNPKCHFCGLMLEDEGVFGSVHIGTGTNITLGGHVKAACHYDLIMTGATIVADGRTILKDGQPQI